MVNMHAFKFYAHMSMFRVAAVALAVDGVDQAKTHICACSRMSWRKINENNLVEIFRSNVRVDCGSEFLRVNFVRTSQQIHRYDKLPRLNVWHVYPSSLHEFVRTPNPSPLHSFAAECSRHAHVKILDR